MLVAPDHPSLRYGGYFDRRDPRAVRFAWPGTHIEASFEGSSLAARFTDTPVEDEVRETDWLTVVIDDGPPQTLALTEGLREYELAKGLSPGRHRVLIWKRTEPAVGVVTFHGLVLAPGAAPGPPATQPTRRMLFVGDSVTAGYGNEGRDASCRWSAATENNFATYGAIAARELDAEYVAAAWSGKGVVRNYDAQDDALLARLRERAIPTEDDSPPASSDPADVVVVNLGTNDFAQGVPTRKAFIDTYVALLESLRAQHPEALFVLQIGPMLADDHPKPRARSKQRLWISYARAQRRAAGDKKCESLDFWIDRAEGLGCDSHPSLATHARMGRELAAFVRKRLGW
jgi:lysophospholipase L1-like esterase